MGDPISIEMFFQRKVSSLPSAASSTSTETVASATASPSKQFENRKLSFIIRALPKAATQNRRKNGKNQ